MSQSRMAFAPFAALRETIERQPDEYAYLQWRGTAKERTMRDHNALMEDTRGFMKSRVILTAAELGFFTRLHEKPATAEELAKILELDPRATTRVLDVLVTMGILEKQNGRYSVTDEGAYFSSRHPETVLPMVLHLNTLWTNWGNLTEILRKGSNEQKQSGTSFDAEDRKAFIGAMHVVARGISKEITDAYDLSRFKRLLDIGGASGTYTIAFLKKNPRMTGVLFDLADVIPMAKERIGEEGLLDRVELTVGDFYEDELPKGCDLALLSAIIHQNSNAENVELYRKIFRALDPGGAVLIRDHVMDESRTNPAGGAFFALNMLVNTRGGDTYTFGEIKETLETAGFDDVKWLKGGERMDGLVEARKPP
jgi:SAM-dependent methyltransferase